MRWSCPHKLYLPSGASALFEQNQQPNQAVYIEIYFTLGFNSEMFRNPLANVNSKSWTAAGKVSVIVHPGRFPSGVWVRNWTHASKAPVSVKLSSPLLRATAAGLYFVFFAWLLPVSSRLLGESRWISFCLKDILLMSFTMLSVKALGILMKG